MKWTDAGGFGVAVMMGVTVVSLGLALLFIDRPTKRNPGVWLWASAPACGVIAALLAWTLA